ncbi:hypothetical protein [Virgibacillus proomii]|uniref:hypothetical protein n=1 Tax=Virgibacillus proomii TaxID=84407 RepID=UPI001C100E95|nr:hypothetical protein [Virgibacillus proomii]MBU5266228.1 hypothetical protein [Virgibacillus proomii]
MSEKVKLPKEVAEAIENLRNKGFANSDIFDATTSVHDHIDEVDVLSMYFNGNSEPYSQRSYDVLMEALVNGYVVKETPEKVTIPIISDSHNTYQPKGLSIEQYTEKIRLFIEGDRSIFVNANQLRKALAVLKEDA